MGTIAVAGTIESYQPVPRGTLVVVYKCNKITCCTLNRPVASNGNVLHRLLIVRNRYSYNGRQRLHNRFRRGLGIVIDDVQRVGKAATMLLFGKCHEQIFQQPWPFKGWYADSYVVEWTAGWYVIHGRQTID